jgi:flavodoxin
MKNSLVIYDSVFGNTEKIAQAMANAKSDGEII